MLKEEDADEDDGDEGDEGDEVRAYFGEESTEEYCYQWNLCPEVEEEESRNLRAFVYAVIRGDFDQVGFWLSQGVNPDRIPPKSSEYTVVQLAVMNRRWRETRELLEHSSLLHVRDAHGRSLMHLASMSGCIETLVIVWDGGGYSDIFSQDNSGDTPLHLASYSRNVQMYEWLISVGPESLHIKNHLGRRPEEIGESDD